MEKVLVVVDMQNDFVRGSLGSEEAKGIIPQVVQKIEHYLANGYKVFFTLDTHSADYLSTQEGKNLPVIHCIEHTEGWHLVEELQKFLADAYRVKKQVYSHKKSTFADTELASLIWREHESNDLEVELIGVCTDICVVSNALVLKANFPEMPILVDASCCAGVTVEKHQATLEVLKSCQVKVINE